MVSAISTSATVVPSFKSNGDEQTKKYSFWDKVGNRISRANYQAAVIPIGIGINQFSSQQAQELLAQKPRKLKSEECNTLKEQLIEDFVSPTEKFFKKVKCITKSSFFFSLAGLILSIPLLVKGKIPLNAITNYAFLGTLTGGTSGYFYAKHKYGE